MSKRYHPGDRLRPFALFSGCTQRELAALDRLFTHLQFSGGRRLIDEGAAGREVYLIKQGTVSVHRNGQPISQVGPGDVVGELALLAGQPRNADVCANGPVDALVQSAGEFEAMLRISPTVAERLEAIAWRRTAAGS